MHQVCIRWSSGMKVVFAFSKGDPGGNAVGGMWILWVCPASEGCAVVTSTSHARETSNTISYKVSGLYLGALGGTVRLVLHNYLGRKHARGALPGTLLVHLMERFPARSALGGTDGALGGTFNIETRLH